jgi:hypothetical protein
MHPLGSENADNSESDGGPPVKAAASVTCKQHPDVAASFACIECHTPVCETCAFHEQDGSVLCPECKVNQLKPPPVLTLVDQPVVPIPAEARCKQHPNVAATQQCKLCANYLCSTCDFSLPNGIHVCPTCATVPRSPLGARGRKFLIGSYAAAIWSTVGLACLVSGAFGGVAQTKADEMVLGWVLLLFVLVPAVVGLALASSAKRQRATNPPSLWIALVWNSIIIGCFLLLTIIGLMN